MVRRGFLGKQETGDKDEDRNRHSKDGGGMI
jgi:hypothetical protein